MDTRLNTPWFALRYGIGLTATFAGFDKFLNLLADWSAYVSPVAAQLLPVSVPTFMGIVGVIEIAVGIAILAGWTRIGAYVASAWLLAIAGNLVLAGFLDIAVRDIVMSLAAFTLARFAEVRETIPSSSANRAPGDAAGSDLGLTPNRPLRPSASIVYFLRDRAVLWTRRGVQRRGVTADNPSSRCLFSNNMSGRR